MSDYHEMYENWNQLGYDPAYVGEEQSEQNNEPVDIDAWVQIGEALKRVYPLGKVYRVDVKHREFLSDEDFDGGP